MVDEPRYIEFTRGAVDDVVGVMDAMTTTHTGWINFQPAVDVDDVPPPRSVVFGLFSNRGPDVPLGTWTPASAPGRGRAEPAMIGLQHGAGTRAVGRLADVGRPVPDGWVVVQDYSKKGLVVAVPPEASHAEVVDWLIAAASALTDVRLTGTWRAAIYDG